jgi:glycosyltransferase involved in cell wall biosynthesis
MALGIPAIVSPVGVNTKIVDHHVNGFVCETKDEWRKTLRSILENPYSLQRYSELARQKIEVNYSVKSNTTEFLHLFDFE